MNLPKASYGLALLIICLAAATGLAAPHGGFCENYKHSNGKKVAFNDLREITLPNLSLLEVDGKRNGGIKVTGENRADILIRACVRTWAESDAAARAFANNTRIETAGFVRAENPDESAKWSVSYQILVPTMTNLKLRARNGGISIKAVNGTLEFETRNGGIKLDGLAGDVRGRTTNGGVKVILAGNTWVGGGLDVETKNGGVKLMMPANYSANVETGTVNGGFRSDFAELAVEKKKGDNSYYQRNKRVNASLNGGGAPIRVMTTNGGVKISSLTGKKL